VNRQQRRAAARRGKPLANSASARAPGGRQTLSSALFANTMRHYQAGQFREANQICQQILAINPNDIPALHIAGLIAFRAGHYEVAVNVLSKAIKLNDQFPDLHSSIAGALQGLGCFDEAITHYQRALALDPDYVEALYNSGNVLLKLRRYDEALANYDRALAIVPNFAQALNNRGNTWLELRYFDKALADFDRALAIEPKFVHALGNRAAALTELKQPEEALVSCDRALAINPADVTALANRGNAFFERRRYAEAAKDFDRLLLIDPDYPYVQAKALYYRLLHCDWTGYGSAVASIVSNVAAGKRTAIPYMFLNIGDSANAQMTCAKAFSRDKHPASGRALWQGERYGNAKIRIAYLSADFRHHPMAYLMVGVFEAHDKSRFETIALSIGPNPQDEFRKRLENSFDHFIDVQTKNDRDLARLVKELEIDIVVDLMGYTNNSRPGILAFRPAPVQVNFLGYAATMGAQYIDYIMADRFVIPEDDRFFYTEKIVYLPDSYYPPGSEWAISEHVPTRVDAGLPETGFVFCCFNQLWKIAPPIFDIWMRLLLQVEGSVLWLVDDNATALRNLQQEAVRRGVAPERLVFAPRVKLDDYLARFGLADLFLDTLPYNAHTTASDALRAGLPVVTCAGSSFAGRVAGSLLQAIGLPELITNTLEDYEALVLKLVRDQILLMQIRTKLTRNRQSSPLFDIGRFCHHIESAYQTMWERYQRGESPAAFAVTSGGAAANQR
jgi:protein O-GlcNAc transferase